MSMSNKLPLRNTHYLVLQGDYGLKGWEDIVVETVSDLTKIIQMQNDIIELRQQYMKYEKFKYRIVHRREMNPDWFIRIGVHL